MSTKGPAATRFCFCCSSDGSPPDSESMVAIHEVSEAEVLDPRRECAFSRDHNEALVGKMEASEELKDEKQLARESNGSSMKFDAPPESLLRLSHDTDSQAPKYARRYIICIDRSDGGPLGIVISKDCGESLVVCSLSGGHVTDWNNSVAQKVRVRQGDRIDSVNGTTGNKDLMVEHLQKPTQLVISLTAPVVIRIQGRAPLGLEFFKRKQEEPTLVISEIKFGCVLAWNLKYPQQAVVVKDHLIQVDQWKGSATEMETALQKSQSFDLIFRRYSTTE